MQSRWLCQYVMHVCWAHIIGTCSPRVEVNLAVHEFAKMPLCILFAILWSMIISWIGRESSWAKTSSGFLHKFSLYKGSMGLTVLTLGALLLVISINSLAIYINSLVIFINALVISMCSLVIFLNSLSTMAGWGQLCWHWELSSFSFPLPRRHFLWPDQQKRRKSL